MAEIDRRLKEKEAQLKDYIKKMIEYENDLNEQSGTINFEAYFLKMKMSKRCIANFICIVNV